MYESSYSEEFVKEILKLKKRDKKAFSRVMKKIDEILKTPNPDSYKNLKNELKSFKRVHIGHFVLIFKVNKKKRIIYFEDYKHHDKIYKTKK